MTDEEMAKEYAEVSTNEYKDCLVDIDDKDILKEAIEEAFLAGLKAGRPEWHKVADEDLPPMSVEMHTESPPILNCTKHGYVNVVIGRKHRRTYDWF